MPLWQMVIGALIGSAPRAFVYTALGASISDLTSPLAYVAVAVWCVTAIIGAFAAHRVYRRWRRPGALTRRARGGEDNPLAVELSDVFVSRHHDGARWFE